MRKADLVSGAVLFVLGLLGLFVVIPAQISGHSAYGLPPDFFPRLLTWLLTLMAAALVVSRLMGGGDPGPAIPPEGAATADEADQPPLARADIGFIAAASLLLWAMHWIMGRWGFVPAGILAILLAGSAMGELRHPVRLVLVAALVPVAILWVFRHAFFVFLPG